MARLRWTAPDAVAAAHKLIELAREYLTDLQPRGIDGAFADGLAAAATQVELAWGAATGRLGSQKGMTRALATAIEDAMALVDGVRGAIAHRTTAPQVHAAFTVGDKIARSPGPVKAAIVKILASARAYPDAAQAAHILQTDVADLSAAADRVARAEAAQSSAMGGAQSGTQGKNELLLDLIGRCDQVQGAASLAFARRPDVLARFRSAIPSHARKKAAAATPGGATVAAKTAGK